MQSSTQIYPAVSRTPTATWIGDIPGIISRLDYLAELEYRTPLGLPGLISPNADNATIQRLPRHLPAEYATPLAAMERLITEARQRRSIRIQSWTW